MTLEQINQTGAIWDEVFKERIHQDEQWRLQNKNQYVMKLYEELSELNRVICEAQFTNRANASSARLKNLRKEFIQVAAVIIAMVESLDKSGL